MAKYENNQRVAGFIRRLTGHFSGFSSQSVPMSGQSVNMLHGQIVHDGLRSFIALFTRPGSNDDTVVFSLPCIDLPKENQETILQKLLEWNNGCTQTVHFALDELLNSINLVCVRPMQGITFQEFQYCVSNMAAVKAATAGMLDQFAAGKQ